MVIVKATTAQKKLSGLRAQYEAPAELWDAAVKYFTWADNTPAIKHIVINGHKRDLIQQRTYTLGDLYRHLQCAPAAFSKELKDQQSPLHETAKRIKAVIAVQQLELTTTNIETDGRIVNAVLRQIDKDNGR